MQVEELKNYEIGKQYYFKMSSRKNRIKATLLNKDCVYTGLSLYSGDQSIEFKRKNTTYTAVLYGIESISSI